MPGKREPLLERIKRGDILVADGAMGTMLFSMGLSPGDCPERWNLERPDVLEKIAGLYVDAGADVVQTNTFGGSPLKLAQYSLDDKTEEINRNAVRGVRNAVGDRAYISASCGPCGQLLKPYGDIDPEQVYESFHRQLSAIIVEGVDVICVETMTDMQEARLAIKAARDTAPDTPLMATMTFDATQHGFFTIMGVSVREAAEGLTEAGADIIGSNCGNGIENMVRIAREFRKCTSLPLIIQSNAGIPESKEGALVYPETPQFMAEKAAELVDIGVNIIGGCCGTTPDHIAACRKVVNLHSVM